MSDDLAPPRRPRSRGGVLLAFLLGGVANMAWDLFSADVKYPGVAAVAAAGMVLAAGWWVGGERPEAPLRRTAGPRRG